MFKIQIICIPRLQIMQNLNAFKIGKWNNVCHFGNSPMATESIRRKIYVAEAIHL